MEQISLFDLMLQQSDFPCDDCVFDKHGCCQHDQDENFYCVLGSFQIKHSSVICPRCGRTMTVRQSDVGSDWAQCKCGLTKIFRNQGNRPSCMDAYGGVLCRT